MENLDEQRGVYEMRLEDDPRVYVGFTTESLYQRLLDHQSALSSDRHTVPSLQKAFNKNRSQLVSMKCVIPWDGIQSRRGEGFDARRYTGLRIEREHMKSLIEAGVPLFNEYPTPTSKNMYWKEINRMNLKNHLSATPEVSNV